MALYGIDVSEHNNSIANASADFVIARATWGNRAGGFVDRKYYRHKADAGGKLFGVYHFMTVHDIDSQADFFLDTVGDLIGKAVLCLDYEDLGGKERAPQVHGPSGARRWLDRVYNRTGVRPVIYCNASTAATLRTVALGGYLLWVADWRSNPRTGHTTPPAPRTGAWSSAILHQYSARGSIPGYSGDFLDMDIFHGNASTWQGLARGSNSSATGSEDDVVTPADINAIATAVWAATFGDRGTAGTLLNKAAYQDDDFFHHIATRTGADAATRVWAATFGSEDETAGKRLATAAVRADFGASCAYHAQQNTAPIRRPGDPNADAEGYKSLRQELADCYTEVLTLKETVSKILEKLS